MDSKEEMRAYFERWKAVEAVQIEERRQASIELRWERLNAAYCIARVLGLLQPDPSEMGVFKRWARLKEKATNQTLKT